MFRPYYLAREWIELGHSVTIVGATYSHVRSKSPPHGEEIWHGIRYTWIKTRKYNGNGLCRMIAMLQFVVKTWLRARRIATKFHPDVVIASSTYPLDVYPARKLARLADAKFCFELHDLWPLSPIELGGYSRHHPFIKIMQKAEDYYCKHADKVISIIPLAQEYLISRGMNKDKFYHIPNGIDLEEWNNQQALPDELARETKNLKTKYDFLIAYAGAHGLANSLTTLLEAADRLSNKGVAIVLVGGGPEKESLMKEAKYKNLTNVYFFNTISKKQIPSFLSQFDALFIGLKKESLFRFGISPNKIFDYMMAAKPIVQAIDAGNNLVMEADCGLYAEAENPDAIANAILHLKSLPEQERSRLGKNGREFVLKNHTYSVLARSFLEALAN